MNSTFTHRIDTRNMDGSTKRYEELKSYWRILIKYFLAKSKKIKISYWPKDLETLSDHNDPLPTFGLGVKLLKDHCLKTQKIKDIDMEELFCPVNSETRKIILMEDSNRNHFYIHITPWFHIELLDESDLPIFYSGDHGSDILMKISAQDIINLREKGFDKNILIDIHATDCGTHQRMKTGFENNNFNMDSVS